MKAQSQEIYEFIKTYVEEHTFPPSHQEIADGCFIAKGTVKYNLKKLEDAGLIYLEKGRARGITLLE